MGKTVHAFFTNRELDLSVPLTPYMWRCEETTEGHEVGRAAAPADSGGDGSRFRRHAGARAWWARLITSLLSRMLSSIGTASKGPAPPTTVAPPTAGHCSPIQLLCGAQFDAPVVPDQGAWCAPCDVHAPSSRPEGQRGQPLRCGHVHPGHPRQRRPDGPGGAHPRGQLRRWLRRRAGLCPG